MITLFTGTPGGGKSAHVSEIIYYTLRWGGYAVCNFDIAENMIGGKSQKHFFYIPNDHLTPEILITIGQEHIKMYGHKEDSLLLVLDECQILFNAREWNSGGRAEWLSFFTQHRKLNYRIILIAQFDGMVDRQIRSLIEYQVVHRKVSNFGMFGKIVGLFTFNRLFCAVKIWYPLKERLSAEFFLLDSKTIKIYDTYATFSDVKKVGKK